jgi:hypothetical protein
MASLIISNGFLGQNVETSGGPSTYAINPDCTGSITFPTNTLGTLFYTVFVSPSGDEFRLIATNPGFIVAGTATRVSK